MSALLTHHDLEYRAGRGPAGFIPPSCSWSTLPTGVVSNRIWNADPDAGAMVLYLREIAHHALLSAEEEVLLAQRLDAGKAAAGELSVGAGSLPEQLRIE
ncbi:MAG: hypothetical protein JO023_18090, partial [Chloroflexi bacterium]|nr:hypothetical protein [Chloroflexota bacterium]